MHVAPSVRMCCSNQKTMIDKISVKLALGVETAPACRNTISRLINPSGDLFLIK